MKEFTIEEKAKRYDEAIEIINDYYQKTRYSSLICASNDIEVLEKAFPELKQSEDEKMLNQLHSWMKEFGGAEEYTEKVYQWIKGLIEKQGEHAKFCDSIQVGDKVTRNKDGVLVNLSQLKRVAKKDEKQGNNMGISEATKRKLEDNLNKALEKETPESWNEFLDEQGEHKPWSEEDEDILNTIINHFKVDIGCTDEDDMVRWLKSIKDRVQPQWKPSDEQMDALRYVTNFDYGGHKATLVSLYEQLKKLK